jgi:hypothetical protein
VSRSFHQLIDRFGHSAAAAAFAWGILTSVCEAQVADLSIENIPDAIIVTPLREQTVRLVVRNLGPDTVVSVRAGLGRRFDPALLAVTPSASCTITADVNPEGVLLVWEVGPLLAGATASCNFTFRATSLSPTDQVSFRNSAFQAGNTDPNIFNSFATLLVNRSALDRPTDLAVSAQRLPGGLQPAGTTQQVELTIRNLGPNAVPNLAIVSNTFVVAFPFAVGYRGYDIFPNPSTPPCEFVRDLEFPAAQVLLLINSPVPAGAAVRCSVSLTALEPTPAQATLEWRAAPNGPGVYDLDDSNNQVVLQIPFQAPIPVLVLEGRGAAVLAGMIAILGLLVIALRNWRMR